MIDSYWDSVTSIPPISNENYNFIIIGIRNTLHRILSNKVGIGSHFRWYRPQIDPLRTIRKRSDGYINQLIVEEYFNINHYVPYLIDIYSIKIFLVIETCENDCLCFIDTTNINGENITGIEGNIIAYRVLINDVEVSYEDLPFFYNSFRKREYFLKWFERNSTNYDEIVAFLRNDKKERLKNYKLLLLSNELGLLETNNLTYVGESLIGRYIWRQHGSRRVK